jgi:hypothetical protein
LPASLVAIAAAAVAAVVLLLALGVIAPADVSLDSPSLEDRLAALYDAPVATRAAFGAGALAVGLIAVAVALRLLGPGGSRSSGAAMHVLDSDDRGFVVVDSRGIAIVAEEAAHTAPGVVNAEVDVTPRSARQVKLRVEIDVYPGANVKQAGSEARERARQAVEELVGIEVGAISASTHVLEPEEMARVLM